MRSIEVTPADQDSTPVSLQEVKDHLRIEHSLEDDILLKMAIGATTMVETECSRLLSPATVIVTYNVPRTKGNPGFQDIDTHVYDPDKIFSEIKLPRSPVQSITSVELMGLDGTATDLDSSLYYFDAASQFINWTNGLFYLTDYKTPILKVTFEAGYATGGVPEDIKRSILIVVADMYEYRDSEVVYVPQKASHLLKKYRTAKFAG